MTERTRRKTHRGNGEADGTDFPHGYNAESEAPEPETPAPDTPDRWSPEYQGLGQDFGELAGGQKKPKLIKVERPTKTRVFRAHPTLRIQTMLLVLKEDNETYLIDKPLRKALPPAVKSLCGEYTLVPCVSKGGTPFLWPVRMADPDGKWNVWHSSAWQIAQGAVERWTRLYANRDAGHYDSDQDGRPLEAQQGADWPELSGSEWLRLAFQEHMIDSLDHPVVRRLQLED